MWNCTHFFSIYWTRSGRSEGCVSLEWPQPAHASPCWNIESLTSNEKAKKANQNNPKYYEWYIRHRCKKASGICMSSLSRLALTPPALVAFHLSCFLSLTSGSWSWSWKHAIVNSSLLLHIPLLTMACISPEAVSCVVPWLVTFTSVFAFSCLGHPDLAS